MRYGIEAGDDTREQIDKPIHCPLVSEWEIVMQNYLSLFNSFYQQIWRKVNAIQD